jgi:hypothetical protein
MNRIYWAIFFAIFLGAILQSKDSVLEKEPDILSYLPGPHELGTWHQVDSARIFVGEDLYTMIDGGADIYFEYGFNQAVSAEYQNGQESSIKLELYRMSDDSAAFGIFSNGEYSFNGKRVEIGDGGIFGKYYIAFRKNSHLVLFTASDTLSETIAEMFNIATQVDKRLGRRGTIPRLINYLPGSNLISCIYLRGLLGLSSIYMFDIDNIFELKEGIIGKYQNHQLFIFNYETEEKTEQVYKNAHKIFKAGNRFQKFKDSGTHYSMRDQKGRSILIKRYKNLIFVIMTEHEKLLDDISNYIHDHLKSINTKGAK